MTNKQQVDDQNNNQAVNQSKQTADTVGRNVSSTAKQSTKTTQTLSLQQKKTAEQGQMPNQ